MIKNVSLSCPEHFLTPFVIASKRTLMETNLSNIRREYTKNSSMQCNGYSDPFDQFKHWLEDAIQADEEEPTAMVIATVSAEGHPSTRTVLLKGVENGKFIFFTNYESRKGKQLSGNPFISLTFVWHKLERQIHIEGVTEKCSKDTSDIYFASRPYKSRIGARISPQSQVIRSRIEIIRAFVNEAVRMIGQEVPRPENWGGFAVIPTRFEFWQGRRNRLHDRVQYTLNGENTWKKVKLAP